MIKKTPIAKTKARRTHKPKKSTAIAPEEQTEVPAADNAELMVSAASELEAEQAAVPDVADTRPELSFAGRVPPAEMERSRPSRRRAIFIDVENTSKASRLVSVLEVLAVDRLTWSVDLVASGNWRVIGAETARLLAQAGAQLVHSAPKTGVRDWSDLRIAVSAGVWIASARSGDRLEIVSDDKAFDAVGDVAASLGVEFTRVSPRGIGLVGAPAEHSEPEPHVPRTSHRGSGRRRGRKVQARPPSPPALAEPGQEDAVPPSAQPTVADESAMGPTVSSPAAGAPVEDLVATIRELLATSTRGVTLDMIAARLKALGFTRPPGSSRLVTRVRALREFQVSPRGTVTVAGEASAGAEPAAAQQPDPSKPRRRRGRGRGGRRPPPQNDPPS